MKKYYASTSQEMTQSEKDHMALSRSLAGECVVLLENDGALPLGKGSSLALFGNGARQTVKGGTGSGDVNSRFVVTIEEGLEAAEFKLPSRTWLDRYTQKRQDDIDAYHKLVTEKSVEMNVPESLVTFYYPLKETAPVLVDELDLQAAEADTAIYVIARNSGEGADRNNAEGDYLPYPEELENLKLLGTHFNKVIVVLNIGGVMDLTQIKAVPGISAIVLMSQLGNIGGYVLGDVLTGDVNPSGKLADTWAAAYGDYPSSETFSHNNGDVDDDNYADGIYVGYRYFDSFGKKPLYPFGYGLSYTTFAMTVSEAALEGTAIRLAVKVSNTGRVPGKEVVQVYYSAPAGKLHKPYQELAAFAKTGLLAPGETETVTISFDARDMASYCEKCASWVLERGCYVIRVGSSSAETKAACGVVLDETVRTLICTNVCARDNDFEELAAESRSLELPEVLLKLSAAEIRTETAAYQKERQVMTTDKTEKLTLEDIKAGRCSVEELVAQLSVEELAQMCVGTLRLDQGEIIGNASNMAPGAAGDSCGILEEDRGIKGMVMADGPAGLRLQPHFKTLKDGTMVKGGSILGDIVEPFDESVDEADVINYYQYCTAIPIGWALAQSWNTALLEAVGDMVGTEMEQFGIDLWLAPALNIHRNPLCGRNFEYYSEDPVLAGKTAAAITRGVQKHPGKGTCIKHYALNNQEDNRYFTNAHAGERAIREIYVKGFEIAVRESQPLSLMTSYNLLNGIHTANSCDLIQHMLRDEWGYKGLVMTDWFTSVDIPEMTGGRGAKYGISASTGCVKAGNDIQMPGCQKNVDDLVVSVKENKVIDGYQVTLADLQYNAANVIRIAVKCTV